MITIRAADRPNDTHMLSAVFAVESAFQHKVNEKSDYYQRSVRYLIEVGLDQQTALENLKLEKSSLDIVATQSSQERESLYASVKVDLAQGLIGTRILVVHRDNIHNFRGVETVADLQKFRICVGRDWPDRLVLEHAKIPVLTRLHTNELYEALEAKQCDALTRAIYEVRDELLARPLQAIAVDPYLVLHYPASQQVFLAKGRPKLKAALESGLKELEREGILSEILELVYGDSIRHVEFKGRKVLDLTNPAAPDWLVQKQQILQQRAWYR